MRPIPSLRSALVVCALALSGACGAADDGPPRSALIVTLDTTRADALGCLGGPAGLTPHLDALALESLVFEQARTTAPVTLPAHASMFTGLAPLRHGARDNSLNPLPDSALTLAERARERGLATGAFVSAAVLDAAFGLDQGFDTYVGPARPAGGAASGAYVERPADATIDDALAWLRAREQGRGFLLWVHLFDPHAPYEPPVDLLQRAGGDAYLGEVALVDRAVGRLLDGLDEAGLDSSTLVVVVADHGEGRGQHGEPSHGALTYDTTMHVPLLVRHPGGLRAGEREGAVVSVMDVAPSVAAALGLAPLPGIDGIDILSSPLPAGRGVYFESCYGFLHYGWSPIAGWIDDAGKFVHDGEEQLFEPRSDVGELRDLAPAAPARLGPYREAIADLARRPRLEAGGEVSSALLGQLRSLGYATGGGGFESDIPEPLAPTGRVPARSRGEEVRRMNQAAQLAGAGRYAEAAELLRGVLVENPDNSTSSERLASFLIADGRCEEALVILRQLSAAGSRRADTYLNTGFCLQQAGRDEEAVLQFRQALELDPGNARAMQNLVVVLTRLGRPEEARPFRERLEGAGR